MKGKSFFSLTTDHSKRGCCLVQASVMQINDFIGDKKFLVIPVYQRNYDWKEANCAQLFDDVERIITDKKDHFIGTFVYQHKPAAGIFQELIIIDGQQRITSTILLAKAISDASDDEDFQSDICATFIKHSKGDMKGKCKLCPNKYDRETFERLMDGDTDVEDGALTKNYNFFRQKVSASKFSPKQLHDAIYRLKIVSILLQDENPQEIFESLNSTGLGLSKADLIRNFLLMPLSCDVQEELYNAYWYKMEEFLRPSGNVENFIVQYLITKRKSDKVTATKNQRLSSRNLYETFKRFYDATFSAAEPCLKDMLHYAKYFRRLIFDADTQYSRLPAPDKKFYELTYLLKADNAPIILMYLLDRHDKKNLDETTLVKFVDAMISLAFRARVCGNTGITSQFAGNVLARLDREKVLDEKIFWQAITFGKGTYAFPNDKDFQTALVNNKLYETLKSDGCKYLLYSLQRAAHAKELPSYAEATVEHIMPQKLNAEWKNFLGARDDIQTHEIWLHTLGNLTLTGENSTLSNASFDAKKKIYARSNFSYTRALTNYSEWTSRQIQSRARTLAGEAVKIWTLPEEFDSRVLRGGDTFNLDSDFSLLKGSKPISVFIGDAEIKLPHWQKILREVVRRLYATDKDIFRQAAQMKNVRKSLFTTEQTNFQIDENFFMNINFDTRECLRVMKILVENFDELSGYNFKDEIYFIVHHNLNIN